MVCISCDSTSQNSHQEVFFPWQRLVKEPHTPWPSAVLTEQWLWPPVCNSPLSVTVHRCSWSLQPLLISLGPQLLPDSPSKWEWAWATGQTWGTVGRNWAGRWHLSPLHESEATSYLAGSRQGRKVHTEQTMLPCLPALQCLKNQMSPLPIVCFKKHMCSLIWCPGWPRVQFWTYTVFINI